MDTCTMKGRKIETVYKNSIRKTSESESNDKKAAEIVEKNIDSFKKCYPNLSMEELKFFTRTDDDQEEELQHHLCMCYIEDLSNYKNEPIISDVELQESITVPAKIDNADKKQMDKINKELNSKKETIGKLKETNKKLEKDIEILKEKIAKLQKNTSSGYSDAYVNNLKDQIDDCRTEVADLKREKANVESKKAEFENKLNDIKKINSDFIEREKELRNQIECLNKKITEFEPSDMGVILRVSPTDLYSTMLEDGYYEVRLASDYSYLTMKKSDSGKASCWNHTMKLPKLGIYIPFQSEQKYNATFSNGIIKILLHGN